MAPRLLPVLGTGRRREKGGSRLILPEKPTRSPTPPRRARILVVDDEVAIGKAIERALSRRHDVTVFSSGKEALARLLGGARFDVIVSDLMMPEVTGMDIHAQLSRNVPDQAARMVFLTGGAYVPIAREFLARVPNPWLEKPFDMPQLLALVTALL